MSPKNRKDAIRQKLLAGMVARFAVVLWAVSLLTFGLLYIAPGDPAAIILGAQSETASMEKVAELRQRLGLNRPWPVLYVDWLSRCMKGDLGVSFRTGEPVIRLLCQRIPATLILASSTILFIVIFSTLSGLLSAWRPNGFFDRAGRMVSILALSIPNYWLGLLLIYLLALRLGWVPVFGRDGVRSLVLPTITLGLSTAFAQGRILRASLLDIMTQDYIRFARSKGVSRLCIFFRHVLRNALPPILTMWGTSLGRLLGGSVLVESVFTWPGLGRLTVEAVINRDLPVVQGAVLFLALAFVGTNFTVDILYGLIDPKLAIRQKKQGVNGG